MQGVESTIQRLTAKQAVEAAFRHFDELVRAASVDKMRHILLDGLDYDEASNTWAVTIGFDVGRSRTEEKGAFISAFGAEQAHEPIREAREFTLDGTSGELRGMRRV